MVTEKEVYALRRQSARDGVTRQPSSQADCYDKQLLLPPTVVKRFVSLRLFKAIHSSGFIDKPYQIIHLKRKRAVMHKKFGGKFAVNVSAADTRRNARPGAASSSTSEPENDAGKPTEEMNKELPSQALEGTKLMKAQEEVTELDDVVPSQPLNIPRPQLRLASDGHTRIPNEQSLFIDSTEAARRQLASTPAIVEDGNFPLINIIKGMESKRWTPEEIEHLYLALRMVGLDFYLMAQFFPMRNRKELKRKYLKEAKRDPNILAFIVNNKLPLNEETIRAGPRRVEGARAPQEPGSGKKVPTPTQRKKAADQRTPVKTGTTPQKRKSSKQMDDTTTVQAEKRVEIGQNPLKYHPVSRKVDPKIIPIITNIVCGFDFGAEVDLCKVTQYCVAEYDPAFPHRVALHLVQPKISANIFSSGKVGCSGATSLEEARLATRKIARFVKSCGVPNVKYLNFRVTTISATVKLDFNIDLDELFQNNRRFCRYKRDNFPAVLWNLENPKVTLAIFAPGSINLSGGKTMTDVCDAYDKIFKIVEKFKK